MESPLKGKEQIEYWQNNLSSTQIKGMTRVLDYFEIKLYNNQPYPVDSI